MKVQQSRLWQDMVSGKIYDARDSRLIEELGRIKVLLQHYNNTNPADTLNLTRLIREILGSCGENVKILQPFRCDFGCNIHVGENFFANFNLTILDEAPVRIGNNAFIGPNTSIYTACHSLLPDERNSGREWARPVTIGNNVWLGGNTIILPGVTIGDNVTVGAGSVVTKDIPSNEVWVGNPARFIKRI